ncbi:3'(2'),5'-bisphosphate nucleotidase CysQ [Nitratireductor mangrovi]|uniref:3'(2'),5'-bisphosphate nucleotidase CysQ n=1 Tax=Nitratireductor mangrovi TaxID=2599600 RepID=A0A5B8KU91_9HYPH|nr:3'(2'),5'-bisphosphate nucleotidase CysQ [Nitratireductor mangrovi]QDY99142.1 3'(2'),5'-bisphosphate nucleotidase CysQ [Nitratireductor mangrovi]
MPGAEAFSSDESDLDLVRDAAAEAGRIALRYFRKDPDVWMKGGNSPVSEADISVDRFLRRTLGGARPDYGWLSEETAGHERRGAHRTFVVDPIDGTRGFIEGRSTWCVSVAVVEGGRAVAGVLDCPAKNEIYWARRGAGAFLNGRAIAVRKAGPTPMVGGPKPLIDAVAEPLRATLKRTPYVPSLAYRIALIASGQLDATFVKPNSHDWDLAAVDLVLTEAGGEVLDENGDRPIYAGPSPRHGALVAGSGPLLAGLARAIAAGAPESAGTR